MNKSRKWLLFCIPGLLGFALLYVVPFFEAVWYSFLSDMFSKEFAWFRNYDKVLRNEYFILAARNTLVFLAVGCFCVMIIGVVLAFCIARLFNDSAVLKGVLFLPFLVPMSAIIPVWTKVFDVSYFSFKVSEEVPEVFLSQLPLLVMFIWKTVGLIVLVIATAIRKVPSELREAAQIDGAGETRIITGIILPVVKPEVIFAVILTLTEGLKVYRNSFLFYNTDYPPEGAYFLQNYMNNHFAKLNYEILTSATVVFILILSLAIFFFHAVERRVSKWL